MGPGAAAEMRRPRPALVCATAGGPLLPGIVLAADERPPATTGVHVWINAAAARKLTPGALVEANACKLPLRNHREEPAAPANAPACVTIPRINEAPGASTRGFAGGVQRVG
jgi:hypothetical protein